ncbi:MAG TPA: penicillin-binding protein 2 [Nocardioidaceae bacterium]|nr:penicillin-binding protein 2 [Nocardioidaceae bacterium]
MNRPIRTMSVFCALLFAALLVNATYLQYFKSESLNERADNRRVTDAEFSRERGAILVAGNPIAESRPTDDRFKFQRVYNKRFRYAHLTGFFSYTFGRNGVEQTENTILSGSDSRLFVNRVIDMIKDSQPKGGSVTLTIDPAAQDAAYDGVQALGPSAKAAVVAIEPRTGKILAMVSNPTYDPNLLASHDLDEVAKSWERLINSPDNPIQNRSIQERLPPGSTFKLVTAAAALANGFRPDSMVPGGATLDLPQTDKTLPNSGGGTCGGDRITLTRALDVSCNVAFGWLGLELGADKLRDQAEKFGFDQHYLDDLNGQVDSVFPDPDEPQTALSAIGQFEVAATPLQMAMVVAGIANDGQVMRPYLVDEERAPDLSVLHKADPQPLSGGPAMSPADAAELQRMMVSVVEQGTGVTAQIPGVEVGGKTGTAQSTPERPPYAWFVSFARVGGQVPVAVAVLVQDAGVQRDQISGSGLAAPIAKAVMEAVLNRQ